MNTSVRRILTATSLSDGSTTAAVCPLRLHANPVQIFMRPLLEYAMLRSIRRCK
jgi:hypothetical protein